MKAGILLAIISLLVIGFLATVVLLQQPSPQTTTVEAPKTTAQTVTSPGTAGFNLIAKLEGDAVPLWADGEALYLAHGIIERPGRGRVELVKLDVGSGAVRRVATLRDDWHGQIYLNLAIGQPIFDGDTAYFLMENSQVVKIVDLVSGEVSTVDKRGTYLYFVGAGSGVLYARDSTAGDIWLVAIDHMGRELWRSPKDPLVLKDPYQHILFTVEDGPRFLLVEAHGFVERSGGWFATPALLVVTLGPDGEARVERRLVSGEVGPMPAVTSYGWAAAAGDGYYVLVAFGQRLFLCRLRGDMAVKWCSGLGEYRLDLSSGGMLLHPLGDGVLVTFPYQVRANTTYEAYETWIRLSFYGPDGKLVASSNYVPNHFPFYISVVGEHDGYLYVLIPTGKQFIGTVSQGTKITLARIGPGGAVHSILSLKDDLAAELFKGEEPWSYRFSDVMHAMIMDHEFILITKATVRDQVYTYVVGSEELLH
ncbi:hypothetical protein HRbin01_00802 [archaeon HR01]|nr:hypothetical protein HRbin01_00802 [archaeon HR01]